MERQATKQFIEIINKLLNEIETLRENQQSSFNIPCIYSVEKGGDVWN